MIFRSLLTALLIVLVSGCAAPPVPDVVTLAIENPPLNLDPRIGLDASSERIASLIFSSLVRRDESSAIVPDLAESWDIPDPTTYIFHLRRGVRFHDGRLLTARDVIYTFRSILDRSVETPKLGTYLLVEEIEAVDDLTVRFSLKEPFAPFLWNLTSGAIGIVPEGAGSELAQHPIGSGPFVFEHYRRDEEVFLRSNPDYYGVQPRIEAVRFKIVPEAIVRALELRKGTVDIALDVLPPDMVEALGDEAELAVMNEDGTNYQYLAFNLEDPVFANVNVRRAIAHAVDRESIIRDLLRNQARRAESVLPPENWAYFDGVDRYDYDPDRARELLREAGYDDLSFTYRTSTDETGLLVATVLQQQLKDVGISMEIRSNEFGTFFADVLAGNFQIYSLRWIGGNNDPDIFNSIFHSEMVPPNGRNRGRYSNPDIDNWVELARREVDQEKRKEYYALVQQTIARDLPYVSLWYPNTVCVFNTRIQGMKLSPTGDYEFLNQIWIDPS